MAITWCAGHRKMHSGTCEPACQGCGRVECLCAEIAEPGCPTCDGDQVIITCTECEGGEVWGEDEIVTCGVCFGDYGRTCPDC